jgi:hypothetical protein
VGELKIEGVKTREEEATDEPENQKRRSISAPVMHIILD